jgi:hypothetical protein
MEKPIMAKAAISPAVKTPSKRFDAAHERLFKSQESIVDNALRHQKAAEKLVTWPAKHFPRTLAYSKRESKIVGHPVSKPTAKNDRPATSSTSRSLPTSKAASRKAATNTISLPSSESKQESKAA